ARAPTQISGVAATERSQSRAHPVVGGQLSLVAGFRLLAGCVVRLAETTTIPAPAGRWQGLVLRNIEPAPTTQHDEKTALAAAAQARPRVAGELARLAANAAPEEDRVLATLPDIMIGGCVAAGADVVRCAHARITDPAEAVAVDQALLVALAAI